MLLEMFMVGLNCFFAGIATGLLLAKQETDGDEVDDPVDILKDGGDADDYSTYCNDRNI